MRFCTLEGLFIGPWCHRTSDDGVCGVLPFRRGANWTSGDTGDATLTRSNSKQELDFDDVKARLDEAKTHLEAGDDDRALAVYESLAKDLQHAGQHGEFLEVAGRMLELDPEHDDIRFAATELLLADIDIYLRYRLHDQASAALGRALEYAPDSTDLRTRLVDAAHQLEDQGLFVDAIRELALLKGAGDGVLAEYLGRAKAWMEPPSRIDELADVFDVEPSAKTREPPPIPTGLEDNELGDETTAPRPDASFRREESQDTREHGRAFGGNHPHTNLLELLELVESSRRIGEIRLERADGYREPDRPAFARIPVRDHRIELGIEINGELYVDKALERVEPELVDRLQASCSGDGEDGLSHADLSTGERSHLYRMTARALVRIVEEASRTAFWVSVRARSTACEHEVSFSPFSLTLSSAAYMLPGSSVVTTRLFDALSDEVEEAWLFARADSDKYPCLPFRTTCTKPLAVSELQKLGCHVVEMAAYHGRLADALAEQRPIATNTSFSDGMWCFVVTETQVVMVRTERIRMGRVLRVANDLIDQVADPSAQANTG